jgi:hypothetical protein
MKGTFKKIRLAFLAKKPAAIQKIRKEYLARKNFARKTRPANNGKGLKNKRPG